MMSLFQTQNFLAEFSNGILNAFEKFCKNPDEDYIKGFIQFINRDERYIEFKLGDNRFLLRVEVVPHSGLAYFKTFKIEEDLKDYPKIKLVHLLDLDILYATNGVFRFVSAKKTTSIYEGKALEHDLTPIHNFNNQYTKEIGNHLQSQANILSEQLVSRMEAKIV